jgi:protease-4
MATAYAQELRLQIRALRDAGKPVMCHLQSATGSQYYACAAANEVLIDHAGDIRLMGVGSTVLLFGDTLREVGVRADFVRIGDYKSAPEQFTRREMSEPAREQTRALLDDVHHRMLVDLAGDLGVTTERVANIIDEGPQMADRAIELGMVKATADGFDLRNGDLALFEGRQRVSQLPADMAGRWGGGPYVGVVVIDDSIVEGENVDIPILDVHMSGAKTIVNEIDALAREPRVRAIVLRIDSPGGSVLATDQIWRAVRRARKRKPVIASMGAVAASGGYYVASAADEIWADPSTLTGSIGIFYGKVDIAELADKLDVGVEHFGRGRRSGAESMFRPFTPDERAALSELVRKYYRMFLDRVAEGRGMKPEDIDKLGQGRVYSGDAALAVGLVDKLGGLGSALVRARQRGNLPRDAEVMVRPARTNQLLDFVMRGKITALAHEGIVTEDEAVPIAPELQRLLRLVATMRAVGGGTPLALMPYEINY